MPKSHATEINKLKKRVQRSMRRIFNKAAYLGISLGLKPRLTTADRRILEQKILPFFAKNKNFQHILFIGCDWYTKFYEKMFANKKYWTLDIDPEKAIFGAKKHICDEFKNIDKYFTREYLDVIICNGVIGWGLDNPEEIDLTILHAYQCLRKGGILIIGWNDIPNRRAILLEDCKSLKKFHPYKFPPLSTSRYRTDSKNSHVYDFYIKLS